MSSRNGLTSAIRMHLREHGEQTASQVHDAMVAEGLVAPEAKNVSAILSQRLAAGEFRREFVDGRVRYSLNPDHQQSEKGEGARLAAELSGTPVTFGTTCMVDPKARARANRRDAFLDAIGEDEVTVDDLVLRLQGWTRQEVLAELRELAGDARVNTRADAKAGRLYWLVDPDDAGSAPAAHSSAALPPVSQKPRVAPAPPSAPVPAAGSVLLEPGAMRERLEAIRDDLELVLTDAIRALLPDELLQQLLAGELAVARSLRCLER